MDACKVFVKMAEREKTENGLTKKGKMKGIYKYCTIVANNIQWKKKGRWHIRYWVESDEMNLSEFFV